MKIELTDLTKDAELKIAKAGGISHKNEIKDLEQARELNRKFIDWEHLSPVEFANATFYVEDVSRSFLAQITRHRHASFMVESQRYNKYDDFDFVIPDKMKERYKHNFDRAPMLDHLLSHAQDVYDMLVESGIDSEDARFFLPEGTATSMYVRANFREWRHIIKLRGLNENSQWEIRKFAQQVLEYLYYEAPSIFENLMDKYEENFLQEGV